MAQPRGRQFTRRAPTALIAVAFLAAQACSSTSQQNKPPPADVTLRVGIGGLPLQTPERGVQQFIANIVQEGLLRSNSNGTLEPWLAEGYDLSPDGLRLTVHLRPNVVFHDGSPVDARVVAEFLKAGLPRTMRNTFEDVASIEADGDRNVVISLHRPSTFVAESFWDAPIQKPNQAAIGTGPFMSSAGGSADGSAQMIANTRYYLGPPTISRIVMKTYPNTRAAWAEMLRAQLDMLYEVDADAIDILNKSKDVTLYGYEKPYQYVMILNARSPKLKDPAIRVALNQAIDRTALVADALKGQGTPSAGPVSPKHKAFRPTSSTFMFDPKAANAYISKRYPARNGPALQLKCLTLPGTQYERLSLIVKQQLEAVGVSLDIEETQPEKIGAAMASHDYEAALIDILSGPNMFRQYRSWIQLVHFESPAVVEALDAVRHAVGDPSYDEAVGRYQRAVADDPPAIFLAWGHPSRAVSNGLNVQAQADRDIIQTLRLWRPSADNRNAANH